MRLRFLILICMFIIRLDVSAETYYLRLDGNDQNRGIENSAEGAWGTINYAFSQLKGGDSLLIDDGLYLVSPLKLQNLHGIETSPTCIKSINVWGAKIRLRDNPEFGNTLVASSCSHLIFDGLEVFGEAPNTGTGIEIDKGSHHVTVRNCYVHDCGCGGISGRGSDYITIENNVVQGNATRSKWNCSGISFLLAKNYDDKPGFHMIIRGNVSFENECRLPFEHGGYDKPTDGNGIICDLFNNSIDNEEGEPGGYRSATLIENNLSFNNGGRGINIFKTDNVTIRNNTTWHNVYVLSEYDKDRGEIESYEAKNLKWYHNLIVQDPGLEIYASNLQQYGEGLMKSENNLIIGEAHFWPTAPYGIRDEVYDKSAQNIPMLKNPTKEVQFESIADFEKYFGLQEGSPARAGTGCYAYGEYRQHIPLVMDFELDHSSETAAVNPFTDYRLQLLFSSAGKKFLVPGYFAADGNAAQTGASEGRIWRVKFTPPFPGEWSYEVSFKRGYLLALEDDPYLGIPLERYHGKSGSFVVLPAKTDGGFFEQRGSVIYKNSHYLHTANGEPLLLFGTNSPENFLAYNGFDGTYASIPGKDFVKSWEPHVKDWKEGDPVWMDGKGKGIIGALNYLASKEMNVLYALTMNIEGDAGDVWPFISHLKKDFTRFDVSKLAQWEIVFNHAEKLGIVLELILQEQENQLLLDDGDTRKERLLYFRELIARFGHHKNIIWNIGEENGGQNSYWPQGQNDQQRFAMIRYLKDHDPYKHPVLMHTYPGHEERDPIVIPLLRFDRFDGLSMQIYDRRDVHGDIIHWRKESAKYNRPWVILMDELGPWHTGTMSDAEDPRHDTIRKEVLWGSLMAGAAGIQWYFGWNTPPNDLDAEDLRSRARIWELSAVAKDLFEQLDYTAMENCNELLISGEAYCFSDRESVFVVYLKQGGEASLDLSQLEGRFSVNWYNPRSGGSLLEGSKAEVRGGQVVKLGKAPAEHKEDWAILLQKM